LAALPQATVDRLFRAADSGEASDPFRVDALDILAANARFFPPEKKGQLMTVLARARITENNNPLIFATIYGRLALAGPATEEMLGQLERIHQRSPLIRCRPTGGGSKPTWQLKPCSNFLLHNATLSGLRCRNS
jgi:hypothetical protein